MRKAIVVIVGMLAGSMQLAAQGWKQVYPAWPAEEYTSIASAGPDTIYITGLNFTLLRSTDRGMHWEQLFRDPGGFDIVRSGYDNGILYLLPGGMPYGDALLQDSTRGFLYAYDSRTGDTSRISYPGAFSKDDWLWLRSELSVAKNALFVCSQPLNLSQSDVLQRSVDGGTSWSRVPLPDSLVGAITFTFRDRSRGLLFAQDRSSGNRLVLYSTLNGGVVWNRNSTIAFDARFNGSLLMELPVSWIDDSTAIIAVDAGSLYMTTDAGSTWGVQNPVLPTKVSSIRMRSNGWGYLTGTSFDVWRTSDFGRTWTMIRQSSASSTHAQGTSIADSAYAVVTPLGDRIVTADGGLTWAGDQMSEFDYIAQLQMADPNVGYMNAKVHTTGLVYDWFRTEDGARTWAPVQRPMVPNYDIVSVSPQVAYAVSADPSSDTLVMVTRDGARTWSVSLTDTITVSFHLSAQAGIRSFLCRGSDTVFIPLNGIMLLSTNAGRAWQKYPTISGSFQGPESQLALDMRHRQYSWLMTNTRVFRSSDDGRSWDTVFTIPPGFTSLKCMAVLSGSDVALATDAYNLIRPNHETGLLYRTTDAGVTWSSSFMYGCFATMSSASWPLFSSGVGTGFNHRQSRVHGSDQLIFTSTADFWKSHVTDRKQNFFARTGFQDAQGGSFFLDQNTGWVVVGNVIFHTSTGGIDAADTPPEPASLALSQNYPNPFSTATTIPYSISGGGEQQLRIELYDAMGRRVSTLYDGTATAGEHVLPFDASGFVPGMYFVRLMTGGKTKVRKMVVVGGR